MSKKVFKIFMTSVLFKENIIKVDRITFKNYEFLKEVSTKKQESLQPKKNYNI